MELPKSKEPLPSVGVSSNISTRLKEFHDAFAEEAERMSGNLFGIAKEVGTEDEYLATLGDSLQLIHNYLLNLMSRPDLLMGYIKRVYLNKESIDKRNDSVIISEDEYMYGDTPIAQPYAPLFKHLWMKHLTDGEDGEKAKIWSFFSAYNNIVEDWVLEGAVHIFDEKTRKFDCRLLRKLKASLESLEDVPEDELEGSEELQAHYDLLRSLRKEFMDYRNSMLPTKGNTPKVSKKPNVTEVSSVTVTKKGKQFDVETVDVKVTKDGKSTKVETMKVKKEMDTDPLAAKKAIVREKPVESKGKKATK